MILATLALMTTTFTFDTGWVDLVASGGSASIPIAVVLPPGTTVYHAEGWMQVECTVNVENHTRARIGEYVALSRLDLFIANAHSGGGPHAFYQGGPVHGGIGLGAGDAIPGAGSDFQSTFVPSPPGQTPWWVTNPNVYAWGLYSNFLPQVDIALASPPEMLSWNGAHSVSSASYTLSFPTIRVRVSGYVVAQ